MHLHTVINFLQFQFFKEFFLLVFAVNWLKKTVKFFSIFQLQKESFKQYF